MINNLQLEYDEGILLENENVSWSREDIDLANLILTNKHIYCEYEKSNGLFKKATEGVNVFSLSDIKIINGQALVQEVKHEGSWCLQIQFKQETEYFTFYDSPKKVIPQWITAINNCLGITTVNSTSASKSTSKAAKHTNLFGNVLTGTTEVLIGMTGSLKAAVDNVTENFKQTAEKDFTSTAYESPTNTTSKPPAIQATNETIDIHHYCTNCGAALTSSAKFCSACGNKVEIIGNDTEIITEKTENAVSSISTPGINITPPPIPNQQRQQEFVGTIMKCSNCGAIISDSTVICPNCGAKITGRSAVTSVQEFKNQLMTIESTRKRGHGGFLGAYLAVDSADTKKLSLIRNFPIPNTIDDIMEFMFLAVANIDVSLSKNTAMNRWNNSAQSMETAATIDRTISNAWVSKMQQAYQKAEIMFPNDQAFPNIQKIYFDKMKELKIKI